MSANLGNSKRLAQTIEGDSDKSVLSAFFLLIVNTYSILKEHLSKLSKFKRTQKRKPRGCLHAHHFFVSRAP